MRGKEKQEEETEQVTEGNNIFADRGKKKLNPFHTHPPHTHNRITLNARYRTYQLYHHRPIDQ